MGVIPGASKRPASFASPADKRDSWELEMTSAKTVDGGRSEVRSYRYRAHSESVPK
jgi:hypothetical protein